MQQTALGKKGVSPKIGEQGVVVLYHFAVVLAFLWLMLMVVWNNPMAWEGVLSRDDNFLLAGLALILALGVIWFGSRRRRFDPFEIVYPITALYILHFPLRSIFIILWPDEARLPTNWPDYAETYLAFALGLSILGMSFFYLGYFWFNSGHLLNFLPEIPFQWVERHLSLKIIILYSLGLLAFMISFLSGSALRFQRLDGDPISYQSQLQLLGTLRLYALYLIWTRKNKSGWNWILAFSLLCVELLLGLITGSKQAIFQTLLAVAFVHHYVWQRDWRRLILTMGVIFLFIFFPLVQNYRVVYKRTLGHIPDPTVSNLVDASSALSTRTTTGGLGVFNTVQAIANRANRIDLLTLIVRYVPNTIDYQRGATLTPIIVGFIPRFLWPNKPTLKLGRFATTVIAQSNDKNTKPVTDVGEFYLNFGILGVPIGMFLLGMFFRAVYVYVQRSNRSSILSALFYLAIFPTLLFGPHAGVASVFIAFVRTTIVMWGVMWFLSASNFTSKNR